MSSQIRTSSGPILALVAAAFITSGCTIATSKPMQAEPEPAAPAEPETMIVEKEVVLSAETLFAFDSAELTAAGRERIRELIRDADEAEGTITVTGHTDRIGPEDYNQGLSERRAQSVAAYMQELGVSGSAIETSGMGESRPVVQCDNDNWNELVDCLQPNRRVAVQYPVIEETEVVVDEEE